MSWAKYHLDHLKSWMDAAKAIAGAVDTLELDADVYVIEGAAEGRLTVLSDIDVLICVNEPEADPWSLRRLILTTAMDKHGLPWDYPVELHIRSRKECSELLRRAKKAIKLR